MNYLNLNYSYLIIEPFINFDQKLGIKQNYLKENQTYSANTHIEFNTSLPLDKLWYLNSSIVNLTDNCQQNSLLTHSCNLQTQLDKKSIIGHYILKLTNNVYNLSKSIGFDLVLPHKPDVKILKPNHCSPFIACEYNKSIVFQCNINAHSINRFLLLSLPCKNLQDCYVNSSELNIMNKLDDRSISYSSSINHDKEYLNLDLILSINQPYIVACFANNSFDKAFTSRIVLPSSISNGEITELKFNNTRLTSDHVDVFEGDSFILKFKFLQQIFDKESIKHYVSTYNRSCHYEIIHNQTEFVYYYFLSFKNITEACNSEYHFEVNRKNVSNFNSAIRSVKINVIKATSPIFKPINCSQYNKIICEKDFANVFKIMINDKEALKLDCRSNSNPRAEAKWFYNDAELNLEDDRYFKIDEKQKLKIFPTRESDSGTYRCSIQNRVGSIEKKFQVKINSNHQKKIIIILSILLAALSTALVVASVTTIQQKRKMNKLAVTTFMKIYNFKLKNFLF